MGARRNYYRSLKKSGQREEQKQERMMPWESSEEWDDLRMKAWRTTGVAQPRKVPPNNSNPSGERRPLGVFLPGSALS